ncbi:hypothetical protein BH10PSE7_BH10PSE7_34500 [soil metagenome]
MTSSSLDQDVGGLRGEEYEAIEQAVMESPRGRWFLTEFAKRNRTADTHMLLSALKRLEEVIGPGDDMETPSLIPDFAKAILSTRAEIAALRSDMLAGGGVIANDNEMFNRMAEESRVYAKRFTRHSTKLQETSAALRASYGEDSQVSSLDTEVNAMSTLSWSNELLSQRMAKALGLLGHIDQEVTEANDAEMRERESTFFSRDKDLFDGPDASPRRDADRDRITITRRTTSDDIEIPLARETPAAEE